MMKLDQDKLFRSFTERRGEADPKAREVLNEFIRVAKLLPPDAVVWDELAALNESWRDTLLDSEVLRHLRAIQPGRAARKDHHPR
jgi:hypothetical protein